MKNYNDFIFEYVDTKNVKKFEKDYEEVSESFFEFWDLLDDKLDDIKQINSSDENDILVANEKAKKVKPTKLTGQPKPTKPTGQQPTGQQPTGQQPTGQQPTGQQPTGQPKPKPAGKKPTYDELEYPNQKPVHDKAYWQKYRKDHNHGGKYGPAKLEPEIVNPEAVQEK